MSENNNGFNPGGKSADSQAKQPHTDIPPVQPQRHNSGALNGLFGRATLSSNLGSGTPDEVLAIYTALIKRAEKQDSGVLLHAVSVDDPTLSIPAILLYSVRNKTVFYAANLLEALGKELSAVVEPTAGGGVVETMRHTAMYFDAHMEKVVTAIVKADAAAAGLGTDLNVINVGSAVIKRTIRLDEANEIAPFFDSNVSAILTNLTILDNKRTSNMRADMIVGKGLILASRNSIDPGSTTTTAHGDYVASDFTAKAVVRQQNQNQDNLHNENSEVIPASVNGFIDFAYHAPNTQQGALSPMGSMPAYDPFIVITNNSPVGGGTFVMDDLLSQLLGLVSVAGIASDYRWVSIFDAAAMGQGGKTSIGTLGLEHNPYPNQKTKLGALKVVSSSTGNNDSNAVTPMTVVNTFCNPTMTIAMDIEQGGANSWVQRVFANCAQGSGEENLIASELDGFTNGAFSKVWDRSQPILAMPSSMVHTGYYTDKSGKVRDLRTLDYLTVLELCKADPAIMESYSKAFMPGMNDKLTLDAMRRLYKDIAPNVVFTGYATRVFFNTNFINAMDQALAASGLSIVLEGLPEVVGNSSRQTAFTGQYIGNVGSAGTFVVPNAAFGNGQNGMPFGMNSMSPMNMPSGF